MIKKKLNYLTILLVIILILSGGYNLYQYRKIRSINKELNYVVYHNLQNFASKGGNIEDDIFYEEQFASIVSANDAYIALSGNHGIPQEEWAYSLEGLLLTIKYLMYNDKEKFNDVFSRSEVCELMFKIADDFEDRDSINEVYKLLN